MDILALGTTLLKERFGLSLDPATVSSALQSLLGGASGQIDLQGLITKVMASGSLSAIVGTWLGGGENAPVTVDQIFEIFGQEKVGSFAAQLNISKSSAAAGLTEVLPKMIDQFTGGANGLDSGDALAGMMDMAKKFF